MGSKKSLPHPKVHLSFKTANKQRRQSMHIKRKSALDAERHKKRAARRREEDQDPRAREARLAKNIPKTLDRKRTWDAVVGDEEDAIGLAVDVQELKRRRVEEEEREKREEDAGVEESEAESDTDNADADSMLDEESEDDEDGDVEDDDKDNLDDEDALQPQSKAIREHNQLASIAPSAVGSTMGSTSSRLDLTPAALISKFPTLFTPPESPKILITTSINSTLHAQAEQLTALFPNSTYIRRSAHRYGHKYSIREISKFAHNRDYTTVLVLMEDQKRPCGLTAVHLPNGPTFHFSISNWIEGKKLPGHGNPTNHYPELILNNFSTPLGLLTAHLFKTMFPPQPEVHGRQVVTLHNQRDYIFLRRHRYIFRDKRTTEKSIVGVDGKELKGVESIRAGLQELGPRFTLKLRRVDRGIQRASGQEWEWKGGSEKVRTRFQL